MATRDSIIFAMKIVDRFQSIINRYNGICNEVLNFNSEIASLMADTAKKNILLDGLAGINVDIATLNNERTAINTSATNALSTMPIITK